MQPFPAVRQIFAEFGYFLIEIGDSFYFNLATFLLTAVGHIMR